MEGTRVSRYHHHWRNSKGAWNHEALPFTGLRPKLIGAPDGSLVLVYTNEEQLFIARGLRESRQTRWQWTELKLPRPHSIYGEALLDLQRWEEEQVLSIYSQEEPKKEIRTKRSEPVDGFPSPLHVVDYRLTHAN